MLARRSSREVSAGFLASYVGGYAIWLTYGLSTGSFPLIVVDAVGLLCGGLTLVVALSLRGKVFRPVTWDNGNTTSPSEGAAAPDPTASHPFEPGLRNEMHSLSEEVQTHAGRENSWLPVRRADR